MGEEIINYEIIAQQGCPYCDMAFNLLKDSGYSVTMLFLERGSQKLTEHKQKNNWNTVPMITKKVITDDDTEETFIGGYTELCKSLQ